MKYVLREKDHLILNFKTISFFPVVAELKEKSVIKSKFSAILLFINNYVKMTRGLTKHP